jgi:hypothetical protein
VTTPQARRHGPSDHPLGIKPAYVPGRLCASTRAPPPRGRRYGRSALPDRSNVSRSAQHSADCWSSVAEPRWTGWCARGVHPWATQMSSAFSKRWGRTISGHLDPGAADWIYLRSTCLPGCGRSTSVQPRPAGRAQGYLDQLVRHRHVRPGRHRLEQPLDASLADAPYLCAARPRLTEAADPGPTGTRPLGPSTVRRGPAPDRERAWDLLRSSGRLLRVPGVQVSAPPCLDLPPS